MSGGPRLVEPENGVSDSVLYRVKMSFCYPAGCQKFESPFLEALEGCECGGVEDNHDPKFGWEKNEDGEYISGKGSLLNQTIASTFCPISKFVEGCCEEKNEDGSYLTEIQIRSRFYAKMHKECTGKPEYDDDHECVCSTFRGACGVLPGDTVFWEYGWGGVTMTHFEPATHEELKERKWLTPMGQYEYMADQFRQKKALEREEKAKSDNLGEQKESKRLKQEG